MTGGQGVDEKVIKKVDYKVGDNFLCYVTGILTRSRMGCRGGLF